MVEEKEIITEKQESPIGRAAFLSRYRESNPDIGEDTEVSDEDLFTFGDTSYNELSNKYTQRASADERLSKAVSGDPRLGAVLSMIAGDDPKSLPYALGKVFGDDLRNFEGEDLEAFETGYKENLEAMAESKKIQEEALANMDNSIATLQQYASDNSLSEEDTDKLLGLVVEYALNLQMGIIPVEFIDFIRKGMNYDEDIQEAAVTGKVEGRNDKIEEKLRTLKGDSIPDLSGGSITGAGKNNPVPAKHKSKDFFGNMKEIK